MVWQLRRATSDDLEAIVAIENATFPSDAWTREAILAELVNANTYYVVAFPVGVPNAIEGYAGLLAPTRSEQGDIQTIAVVEAARGAGLGRTLMGALISEAGSRKLRELFLEVRVDNPAAGHLYDSLGFERIAIRKGYYRDGVDGATMRLTLPEPTVSLA
jgi:ribosomal-protein-alanine acetyltransferase